jgi:hypothetical protein
MESAHTHTHAHTDTHTFTHTHTHHYHYQNHVHTLPYSTHLSFERAEWYLGQTEIIEQISRTLDLMENRSVEICNCVHKNQKDL